MDSTKCRRHINQRNLPGVCPSCLREKLSKISATPEYDRSSGGNWVSGSSSLSSSPPYSFTSSATSAAVGGGKHHRRNDSEAYVSVSMVLNDGLKKSRSVSCAPLSINKGGYSGNFGNVKNIDNFVDNSGDNLKLVEENNGSGKKKVGFFKRFIFFTNKKGGLMHSKTMKERSHISSITSARFN